MIAGAGTHFPGKDLRGRLPGEDESPGGKADATSCGWGLLVGGDNYATLLGLQGQHPWTGRLRGQRSLLQRKGGRRVCLKISQASLCLSLPGETL